MSSQVDLFLKSHFFFLFSTSAMSLLYECINTVIAGRYNKYDQIINRNGSSIITSVLFLHTVLISISSSLPNHSACVQV